MVTPGAAAKVSGPVDPDCRPLANKHATCQGLALDPVSDEIVACACHCHSDGNPSA